MGHDEHVGGRDRGDAWLAARAADLEPARDAPRLGASALAALATSSMRSPSTARAWRRPVVRLSAVGGAAAAFAVVMAAVLGMGGAAPMQPALGLSSTRLHYFVQGPIRPTASKGPQLGGSDALCPFEVRWIVAPDPRLSRRAARTSAYELASASPHQAIVRLRRDFPMIHASRPSRLGRSTQDWLLGTANGPSLQTRSSKGVTTWSYAIAPPSQRTLVREAGRHGRNLPTDASATSMARAFLDRVQAHDLGAATVARTSATVQVAFPFTWHGLTTDLFSSVTFVGGARIERADGPRFRIVARATYPSVSPSLAARIANQPAGTLVSLLPPTSVAATHTGPSVRRPIVYSPCGRDVGRITVTHASMSLVAFALGDRRTWLLPSWTLTGPIRAGWSQGHQLGTVTAVAVNPRYLRYLPAPIIRYRRSRDSVYF